MVTRPTAMAPDASTSPVEWGPEIRVDGKRPEWLVDFDVLQWRHHSDVFRDEQKTAAHRLQWSAGDTDYEVAAIRLPANHPHYSKAPTTPERDPALWDRMTLEEAEARGELCGFGVMGKAGYVQCLRDLGLILPKPVDPATAAVERLLSEYDGAFATTVDETLAAELAHKAFTLGRELAAPEVSHVG